MQITDSGLSTAEVVGITLSSVVSFSAGLLVALVIAYRYTRRLKGQYSPKDTQQPAPMYENITIATSRDIELQEHMYAEVSEITSRDIELNENAAYGVIIDR